MLKRQFAGTRFTFAEDNPEIRDVLKERAEHGQAKIGSSAFARRLMKAEAGAGNSRPQ